MLRFLYYGLVSFICAATSTSAQSSAGPGYTNYDLSITGDPGSVVYETANSPANVPAVTEPDVFLNASVHVGEIDINVSNLTAKINLDAQVLQLLQFNAGVDLSIDRVSLFIFNVTAKVLLEARLENLVAMINDTLNSLDLNPTLATLGQTIGSVVNNTVGALPGGPLVPRSFELENNILYSINDYSGNTHTNRVLSQTGSLVDQFLGNNGDIHSEAVVGSYLSDMTFNGQEQSVIRNGEVVHEREYVYTPYDGLTAVSAIYFNAAGAVVGTQVLSESSAGGSSTIADE
jgi:hypothetical protein